MAVTVASLQAVLDLEKKGFDTGLKESSQQLSGFGKNIAGVVGVVGTIGATIGIFAGVGAAVTGMTNAAREAAAINRDLEQTIRSTGGVAGVTADAARDLADSLSRVTNFEDDAIVKGEAMLLTFTKIGADVFPQATEAMLDMAQKFGSMDSAAVQLGKALNDPIKGITALQRVGVTFSAQQKQQIKDFMAVNDIAAAQKVILSELATEFGGQARAAADPIIQLSNAVGNLNEALGTYFLPIVNRLASAILPGFLAILDALGGAMPGWGEAMADALGPAFDLLGQAITDMGAALTSLQDGLNAVAASLGLGTGKINLFKLALSPLLITISLFAAVIEGLSVIIAGVGHAFEAIGYVVDRVAQGWRNVTAEGTALGNVGRGLITVWNALNQAFTTLQQMIAITQYAWRQLVAEMSRPITIPDWLTPGSPTPLEIGLRGISQAIKTLPPLQLNASGMNPVVGSAGGGNYSRSTILNMGGQSFSFAGPNSNDQALMALFRLLREQLEAAE